MIDDLAIYAQARKIAEAVAPVIKLTHAKIEITVDGGKVLPHNVQISMRPPQPKAQKQM